VTSAGHRQGDRSLKAEPARSVERGLDDSGDAQASRRARHRLKLALVIVAIALALLLATSATAVTGKDTITRYAGIGTPGSSSTGDGGRARAARIDNPKGLATDRYGNLYIAEYSSNRIRKVTPEGIITTIAGTGKKGCDDGPAKQATLFGPTAVAVNIDGEVFFTDGCSNTVRMITRTGAVKIFAGKPYFGSPGGDTHPDGIPATEAYLRGPSGLAVDEKRNVYIADTGNDCIRRVTAAGVISTIAGICSHTIPAGYSGDGGPARAAKMADPAQLAVDKQGNVYVAEIGNNVVRKILKNGQITTFAGTGVDDITFSGEGGPARRAKMSRPVAVAVDGGGNVFIAAGGNARVLKVGLRGTIVSVIRYAARGPSWGDGGPALTGALGAPSGLAVDLRGNLYVSMYDGDEVRKVWNRPPIPSFRGTPQAGKAPLRVDFDARASRDPNGFVTGFSWEFGDNTKGNGRRVSHTYTRPGRYTVTLTVMDDSGASASLRRTITVS
jgi:PKD repeat protein